MFTKIVIAFVAIGVCLRIKQEISNYKFTKRNNKRIERRRRLRDLQEKWVDELLNEITLKTKIKS